MASLLHEAILELLAAHPELLLAALHEPLDPSIDAPEGLELLASSNGHPPPRRLELELRRRNHATPLAAVAVEVQLAKDDDQPFAWLLDHAERHDRLRVPSYLVVITHDPAVAAWAAGPFDFGMITMRPRVLAPVDLLDARGIRLDPSLRQRVTTCNVASATSATGREPNPNARSRPPRLPRDLRANSRSDTHPALGCPSRRSTRG